jgi:hypothetical protein
MRSGPTAEAAIRCCASPAAFTSTQSRVGCGSTATSAVPTIRTSGSTCASAAATAPRHDLPDLGGDKVKTYIAGLATRTRLDQFAANFAFPFAYEAVDDETVRLDLASAMDFLTRKDYIDNWLSETKEQFCGLSFADWTALLTDVGFELDPSSSPIRNDWLIDNRIAPVATLTDTDGNPIDWPTTHLLTVARRPRNG